MNEGLNLNVLEPTDTSWLDMPTGWCEETRQMMDQGMRHFERKRPKMQRNLSFKEQINAECQQARGRKAKDQHDCD